MKSKIKKLLEQLVKFGIVGVIATLLEWIIFYICTRLCFWLCCLCLFESVCILFCVDKKVFFE